MIVHNVVHLRREPTNDAERVSQALMGQTVQIRETRDSWSLVETDDTYAGWAENRWLGEVMAVSLTSIRSVFADVVEEPRADARLRMRLPILAAVQANPLHNPGDEWTTVSLPGRDNPLGWLPVSVFASSRSERLAAIDYAPDFLGTPYLWGGISSFGLDCSGFTQLCYRLAGVVLRRDASLQRGDTRFFPVSFDVLLPGDLVFFGKPDRITHVGMHYGERTFIHASSGAGVMISPWGEERYSPRFVDAWRLEPDRASQPVRKL